MRGRRGETGTLGALVVLASAQGLDVSGGATVSVALPRIGAELDLRAVQLQWVMTAYSAVFAGCLLLGGRLADTWGRRRVFALGIGVFTAASALGAMAGSGAVVVAARGLQGLGAACSVPAGLALLTEVFAPGPARDRALGIYASVGAASFGAGLVAGGLLTGSLGWRSVFAVNAVAGAALLLAAPLTLPPGRPRPQPMDLPAAVLATGALLLVVVAVTQAGTPDGAPSAALAGAGALACAAGFAARERVARQPLVPPALLHVSGVRVAAVAAAAFYIAVAGLLFFAPLYMQGFLGFTPLQSALGVLPMGSVVVASSMVAGRLLPRLGQRPLMAGGLVLIALGVASWALADPNESYWTSLLPGIVIMSLGQGPAFASFTAASLTGVPQLDHGVAGAINVTAQQLGASVGVAALVALVALTAVPGPAGALPGYRTAYLAAAAIALLAAAIAGAAAPATAPAPTTEVEQA
jgi:MFS family permease